MFQKRNLQKAIGIAVLNTVPILLTDSEDETTETEFKKCRWSKPILMSDTNDQPVVRDSLGDAPISTLVHDQPKSRSLHHVPEISSMHHAHHVPEINSMHHVHHVPEIISLQDTHHVPEINPRTPLSLDELFVAQHNFQERPPPLPIHFQLNKNSNQFVKKDKQRNSHHHNKQQLHSPNHTKKPQECYRDHKLRKEEAERFAKSKNHSNRTVTSRNLQRSNDEPSTSSSSNVQTEFDAVSSKFLDNFVSTNEKRPNNEPVVMPQLQPQLVEPVVMLQLFKPVVMPQPQPQLIEPVEVPQPRQQLTKFNDDYFDDMPPQLDKSSPIKPIYIKQEPKEEESYEGECPDKEISKRECLDENVNVKSEIVEEQEPEEPFLGNDENTAEFTDRFIYIKEEAPLDL